MKGVWPSWVTHSSLSPVQSPRPSRTAKAAGDPSVHVLHNARISVSLVGSKSTMMALIFRPLIPPVSLTCLTKSSIAFVCSPNSASAANPSRPASELRDTVGKTTLMLSPVTPRLDVLAVLTEEGEPAGCAVDPEFAVGVEEADAPQAVVPTITEPTIAALVRAAIRGRGARR